MKIMMGTDIHSGVSLIGGPNRHRLFLGTDEVMVHDLDRETAWVSIKGGLPMLMMVRLSDLRTEAQ
jgi:hypothetical protein